MLNRIKLVLLYGGKSGEHEISLRSAASVLAQLDPTRYDITPVGMDKEGCCFINDYQTLLAHKTALPVKTPTSKPLDSLLHHGRFALAADVVFPVVHGPLYEDGGLQGLLTMAGVAFVGCSILSSAIGMDKDIARRLACDQEILAARYRCIDSRANDMQIQQFCQQTSQALGWPLFVKPCAMGSSVGIHKVHDMAAFVNAVADARRYDETVVVESFVKGREIEVAVLEQLNGLPKASIPGEIRVHHPDGFYSYAAKYLDSEATELCIPAILSPELVQKLQWAAVEIFLRLKCKGMARVDFFVNDETGAIYFNEINTLPGFTSISMYPKLWEASGIAYSELLDRLIDLALTQHQLREQLVTHYQ